MGHILNQRTRFEIPRSYVEDLLAKVCIEDVVRRYVPDLKRTGSTLSACCPFHDEKTPSFTVTEKKGFYHCFGCGAHGSAIGFVMEFTNCGFVDAVKELSDMAEMEMPKQEQVDTPERAEERKRFAKHCSATRDAQKTYAWWIENEKATEGKAYLLKRGITEETIAKFGLGYALERRNVIADSKSQYTDKDAMVAAGLVVEKEDGKRYDWFRNRIIFPIYKGKREAEKDYIIGFGGRAIGDQEPKYLNSPEGEFFKKGENLYGLSQALLSKQTSHRIFVVEGYMDTAMLSQYGIENVVATMGTAVTEAQIRKLMKLSAHITFCMDGDKPGRKAARRIAEALLPQLNDLHRMDIMLLPNDMDPDEYVRAHGAQEFLAQAENAVGASDFLIDCQKELEDITSSGGMARYLGAINKLSNQIEYAPIKLAFQNRAATVVGISLDAFMTMMAEHGQVEESQAVSDPRPAGCHEVSISVPARLLSIAIIREPSLAALIEVGMVEPLLSPPEKEMLLPLLSYLAANPAATKEAVSATLAYNPHIGVINEAVRAAQLLSEGFDATAEAKLVIDGYRKMMRVRQVLEAAQTNEAGPPS